MKNLKDNLKESTGNKKILLGLVVTTLIGWLAIAGVTGARKEYGSGSEVYQGYHRLSDDGRNKYVFDSETKTERGSRPPKHRIFGKSYLTDSLTIGKRYNFTTEKRSFPWSKEYIESIISDRSKDSKNK